MRKWEARNSPPTRRASCHEARATLIRHGFCRATFLYFPYCGGFNLLTALADFPKHVCHNFPFAFFSQLFFIQPLVRTLFKALFKKQLAQQHG